MGYHYESHTTTRGPDGSIQSSSSVIVRELDDGEVGILMAGNNSILDPSLTPRMLASPTTDYDVESDALPPSPNDDDYSDNIDTTTDEETWFPALRHNSWIQGLDDDDDDNDDSHKDNETEANVDDDNSGGPGGDMVEKMLETLFATDVVEKEDENDAESGQKTSGGRRGSEYAHRAKKSRRTARSKSRQNRWSTSDRNDDDDDDDAVDSLVPVDIICVMLND
ncbi:hypothetical protein BCR42DRAFT_401802 [Absidia repens]|uniref:Uncharacterized protein n=1 Tax=Absidia repens TaxID=90262 RepID=A0A1X2J309_9FUNG|nr:hypothetical protein BCR42DRAFT_401802 [Absidia repens]